MKIEFADERIKEYVNGSVHFKNTGDDIDVSSANAKVFLKAKHWLDGEWVNVFQPITGLTQKELKEVGGDLFATYPENFPSAEHLAAAGLKYEDAILLSREKLVEINRIGEKSADAILAFAEEK